MKIAIPEEFKGTYWDRKLCVARNSNDTFLIYDYGIKEKLNKMISKDKDPKYDAFNRFMLANIFETKSVNNLLELPEGFEDFSDREVSFVAEEYRVSVTKV
jgi:hypothetical protein